MVLKCTLSPRGKLFVYPSHEGQCSHIDCSMMRTLQFRTVRYIIQGEEGDSAITLRSNIITPASVNQDRSCRLPLLHRLWTADRIVIKLLCSSQMLTGEQKLRSKSFMIMFESHHKLQMATRYYLVISPSPAVTLAIVRMNYKKNTISPSMKQKPPALARS